MSKLGRIQPQQIPTPPDDQISRVTAGPAERRTQITHGSQIRNAVENGIFCTCPGCKKQPELWGQKVHNALAVGKEIRVRCQCGTWAFVSRTHVEIVSDHQATAVIRQILQANSLIPVKA